jgi:tetratricopeptide (TPR) repeat protein
LEKALSLINKALTLEKDAEELADSKDTKGWILYKMGKYTEALPWIKEAAAKLPNEPDIRKHLEAAQTAILKEPHN